MSWFEKNYEKAALGAAAAAALGLCYLGWSKSDGAKNDFGVEFKGIGNNNAAVQNSELIPKSMTSLKLDRSSSQALAGERAVDLFTGIPLFVPAADPTAALDLVTGKMVHEPIDNKWWIHNKLDPGFADSPTRDPDQDGFNNLEEFKAKSDPNDANSIPSLIAKLMYVKDDSVEWTLRPSYGTGQDLPFIYLQTASKAKNKTDPGPQIAPGGTFFEKGLMAGRFKYVKSELRKEFNKRVNTDQEITYAIIEDQKANKKGKLYELPAPLSDVMAMEYKQYDRSAVFTLEAQGNSGKEFKVEENTTFSLPNKKDGKQEYLVKEVTPNAVTVEYTNATGVKQTYEIRKGSFPQMDK